ncbi:MAG: hypothetical protein SFV24_00990 [Gemmatimonadales bacterium]|nr:hypothetical protein [Gemmatimonadales bacterium]
MTGSIVDVWMQHPTRRFQEQPMFESLRRWTRQETIPNLSPDGMAAFLGGTARRVFRLD